ncbi:SEFIR domain-containing protein [Ditylenchus destructor]|uniref:SEFIR domain-containing protein n=1 Tax=Ditylenchus destructor TaxID=166010 RepID=A0AAD4NFT2_9BILA|nr:SEFIR domain-containing protein [Ditylenchus destructor]
MCYLLVRNGYFLKSILWLRIAIVFVLIQRTSADCNYHLAPFYVTNVTHDSTPYLENHTFVQTSKQCDSDLIEFGSLPIDACPDSDVELSLIPQSHFPNGTNLHPYITLNISLVAFIEVDRLFVQFRCLYAPDSEDVYCHDDKKFTNSDGRKVSPCRELTLNHARANTNDTFPPFRFSMDCFHLFGLSQYQVDVTILPKSCRKSFVVSIPLARQLEPKLLDYFKYGEEDTHVPIARTDWSPLVFAEVTPGLSSGVWIRYNTMPWIYESAHVFLTVMIFERNFNSQDTHLLLTRRIVPSHNGFKWENVPAGEYLVFMFVEGFNCYLNCTSATPNLPPLYERFTVGCKICPHTFLNFTLAEDKFTPEWEKSSKFIGVAKSVASAILATLFIAVLSLIVVIWYLRIWVPRQVARRPPISVELTENPSVLLLYTDDCEEHSNAVAALGRILAHNANARVILDQSDLQDPSVRPSVWLLNSIAEAKSIVVVFSEGAQRVMNGEQLAQRRPFPDLFNSALGYVITKISEIDSRDGIPTLNSSHRQVRQANENSKYANAEQVRLAYSPATVVPEFFANDRFGHFIIPQDLGQLIGRIHGVAGENRFANFEHTADVSELTAAMETFVNITKSNPEWLEQRMERNALKPGNERADESGNNLRGEPRLMDRLERLRASRTAEGVPSVQEQEIIAAKFGLHVPTEEERDNVVEDSGVRANHNTAQSNGDIKFELVGDVDKFRPRSISAMTSSSCSSNDITQMYRRKSHRCTECDITFDTQHELRKHNSIRHPKFKKCDHCDYQHKVLAMVRRHMKQSHGPNSVTCTVEGCGLTMPYRNLQRHNRDKHQKSGESMEKYRIETLFGKTKVAADTFGSDLKCDTCGKTQQSKQSLVRHFRRVHEKSYSESPRTKKYPCTETGCNKTFKTPGSFQDHLNRHKGEYPYECEHCAKKFFARAQYVRHLRKYHAMSIKSINRLLRNFPTLLSVKNQPIAAPKIDVPAAKETGTK